METIERASAKPSGEPAVTAPPAAGAVAAPSGDTTTTEGFLAAVGARVRRQRALVHMSRRRLAERSGVSERYLAQLETGRGNMSIVLLRKVALALGLPLAELVAEQGAIARADQ